MIAVSGAGSADQIRLGCPGLLTSRVWLGTVNFSGRVADDDAFRLMDYARDRGITTIDTADIYGWRIRKGHTEELIGRWLAQGGGRRANTVLATKVGESMTDRPDGGGLSARHVIAACEGSLRRLGVDHIDIYQMHRIDRTTPWDEVWQAMDRLITQGKVRYVGSSNFAGWHISASQESALRRHSLGMVSHQCLYNLAARDAELEIVPAAQAYGLGVLAWSPLHGGLLSGALEKIDNGTAVKSAQGRAQVLLPSIRSAVEAYEEFCRDIGVPAAEVGLAWVLSRPGVAGAVIGPRTPEHVDSALRAASRILTDEQCQELDALFPPTGAGGPAPQAWLR